MSPDRSRFPRRLLAAIASLAFLAACQQQETGEATAPRPASATVKQAPPNLAELRNATYTGIQDGPITLTDGEWRGAAFLEGGASRPSVGLFEDFRLTGDLDDDGADEAVVLLWSSSGGSGTFDYLAVVGRDASGAPLNIATAALGDRVQIRAARIVDGRVVVDVVQAGPEDAACCPGQKVRRSFSLIDEKLADISSEDQGRLSIADLASAEWRLTHFDHDEPVSDDIEVTLRFDGNRIGGKSACNRYSGGVTAGDSPGALTVDAPLATTRMACPPPIDDIERRYLAALQGVNQYSFLAGKLALTRSDAGGRATMIFRPHEL